MEQKYDNLFQLIEQDKKAEDFLASLPDYITDMIVARADSVNSLESLQNYADNLLQGDK